MTGRGRSLPRRLREQLDVVAALNAQFAEESAAAAAISRIELPPSDQSECTWQSPRRAARSSAPPSATGRPPVASNRRRYTGTSPPSASVTTWAVTAPTPASLSLIHI